MTDPRSAIGDEWKESICCMSRSESAIAILAAELFFLLGLSGGAI